MCTLSSIVNFRVVLSDLGRIVEQNLQGIEQRYPHVTVDSYVIMPNHVHALLRFEDVNKDQSVILSRIVNVIKSKSTVEYHKRNSVHGSIWQYSFYDQIIRSDKHLYAVREYIHNNPIKWELDELNPLFSELRK